MKRIQVERCPNCKGKGHVMVGAMVFGGPFVWIAALCERNDPNGVTRDTCYRCDGTGFRKFIIEDDGQRA